MALAALQGIRRRCSPQMLPRHGRRLSRCVGKRRRCYANMMEADYHEEILLLADMRERAQH